MQGTPVCWDEVPEELWGILPPDCAIRHDANFLYPYHLRTLMLIVNKRADGAAMVRLLKIMEAGHVSARVPASFGPTADD